MAYKIACLTPIKHIAGAWDNLSRLGEIDYKPHADYHDALLACRQADIAFVNPNKMGYRIDDYFLSHSSLHTVATASTGTNHIDLKAATTHGVKVISLTTEMSIIDRISSTAEHALALTLALVRNIPKAFDAVKNHEWDYQPYIGRQMDKMTVGIIGGGRLGTKYSHYIRAMGSEVIYTDPNDDCIMYKSGCSGRVKLDELLERSDIISLHVHLTEQTFQMVNDDFISKVNKLYLVNTSRGDIVNERAVIDGLKDGNLKGYATDVIVDEFGPIQDSDLIWAAKDGHNVIITPHIGGMTTEAQEIAYNGVIGLLEKQLCTKSA